MDVVIAQHSHVAGSYEEYLGKLIVYGQGNLIFEKLSRNYDTWFEGFIIELKLNTNKIDFNFIPIQQSSKHVGAKKMTKNEAEFMLNELNKRSKMIKNTEFVKEEWRKLCRKDLALYKSRLHGHNRILRVLNRKTNFTKWFYPKWKRMMIRNVIECETHREGLETLWNNEDVDF